MKKIIILCDSCNKSIEENTGYFLRIDPEPTEQYDLCEKCHHKLLMNFFPKSLKVKFASPQA